MVETWIDKNIQSQDPIKESNILEIMDTPIPNAHLGKIFCFSFKIKLKRVIC